MTTCIDLAERFGRKYRIGKDPAYFAEHGGRGRAHDPWLLTIPCRFGHIYPHGGDILAGSVDGHPKVAAELRRLGLTVHQFGADGMTLLFDVADFRAVAEIMKPRRRRQLSAEQRARLADLSAKHGFKRQERIANDAILAPDCVRAG